MDYSNDAPKLDTLESLDMVVVVFATNDLDVSTQHWYGRSLTDEEVIREVLRQLERDYGVDAVTGFEVLSVAR